MGQEHQWSRLQIFWLTIQQILKRLNNINPYEDCWKNSNGDLVRIFHIVLLISDLYLPWSPFQHWGTLRPLSLLLLPLLLRSEHPLDLYVTPYWDALILHGRQIHQVQLTGFCRLIWETFRNILPQRSLHVEIQFEYRILPRWFFLPVSDRR